MRWILFLLVACVIGIAGCGDNTNNGLDGNPDAGFELTEDTSSNSSTTEDANNSDATTHPTPDANPNDDTGANPTTCTTNTDCSGSRSVCDPMSLLCVDCLFDSQCAGDGRCIERVCKTEGTCQSNRDCANVAGKPVCNQALRTCTAACNNSLDCAQGNVCDPMHKQCVQCASNLDCASDERCVESQCKAFLACQSDNQCTPHGLLCDINRGACNECENDAGCPNAYHCTAGRCVVDICLEGEMRCTDRHVEECADGKHFKINQTCQTPQVCRQDGNVAGCGSCTADDQCPGSLECKQGVCERPEGQNCPTALAEARIVGSTNYQSVVLTQPLQNIELNATRSLGDSALTYEWTIIKRPANSQSRLTPNSTSPNPRLWLDLAGVYEIELVAYDENDIASCEPSIVTIHAVPGQEIHIQLTWFAPAIPNPREAYGTDLDLHYRHPLGTSWNEPRYTVYWNNKQSSTHWGNTDLRSNKATMDIDDLIGATTENINHIEPLPGAYEIGVHYYSDHGYGGADATIRVYIQGQLTHEFLEKRMQHKQFWRVGSLQWPSGDMIWVDQLVCDHTLPGFTTSGCRP